MFILSAPSGAGKTTLCRAVLEKFPHLVYSISTTTRAPRSGEEHGVDYFFVSEASFKAGIEENRWAEWASVHDHYYGTSAAFITGHLDDGHDILLDIDVQGMHQIISRFPQSITIFIMPPSMEILKQRMTGRGTDSPEVIAKRMENAEAEIAQKDVYQHIIVNDDLEKAIAQLSAVIRDGRPR